MIIIKIFLDDAREVDCEKYSYNRVWTYSDCITLIDVFKDELKFISLDYYLGSKSPHTGYDVLVYMHEHKIYPKHINIHSGDKDGLERMRKFAEKHFPNTRITTNKCL